MPLPTLLRYHHRCPPNTLEFPPDITDHQSHHVTSNPSISHQICHHNPFLPSPPSPRPPSPPPLATNHDQITSTQLKSLSYNPSIRSQESYKLKEKIKKIKKIKKITGRLSTSTSHQHRKPTREIRVHRNAHKYMEAIDACHQQTVNKRRAPSGGRDTAKRERVS